MFEIQYDVPVQPAMRDSRAASAPRRKYPLEDMEVGGFFFVPDKPTRGISSYISSESKKLGRKFRVRRCRMVQTDRGAWRPAKDGNQLAKVGVGVWRVE